MIETIETEKKPLVIAKFAEGMTWREVAAACGISVNSIWRWAESDPEFKKAIKAAGENADAEVEAVTYQNACDPDPAHNVLRMFWLKSRKGYTDRLAVSQAVTHKFVERARNPRDLARMNGNGTGHTSHNGSS